jgi:hypothetical protein
MEGAKPWNIVILSLFFCLSLGVLLNPSCSIQFSPRREFVFRTWTVARLRKSPKAKSPRLPSSPCKPPTPSHSPPRSDFSESPDTSPKAATAQLHLASSRLPQARSPAAALARRGPSAPEARVGGRTHVGARAGPDPGGVTRIRRTRECGGGHGVLAG